MLDDHPSVPVLMIRDPQSMQLQSVIGIQEFIITCAVREPFVLFADSRAQSLYTGLSRIIRTVHKIKRVSENIVTGTCIRSCSGRSGQTEESVTELAATIILASVGPCIR